MLYKIQRMKPFVVQYLKWASNVTQGHQQCRRSLDFIDFPSETAKLIGRQNRWNGLEGRSRSLAMTQFNRPQFLLVVSSNIVSILYRLWDMKRLIMVKVTENYTTRWIIYYILSIYPVPFSRYFTLKNIVTLKSRLRVTHRANRWNLQKYKYT